MIIAFHVICETARSRSSPVRARYFQTFQTGDFSRGGGGGGGGGGHSGTEGGPHLRYVFRGRRGHFLRPPHVRDFVKEGYFFVTRYEVWGSISPYNPRNIRAE